MKKTIAITMSIFLVLATVLAFGEDLTKNITELLGLAKENSIQSEIDALNNQILIINKEEAMDEKKANDFVGGNRVDALKRKIIVNVDTFNASQAVYYDQVSTLRKEDQLKLDVENATANLVLSSKKLDNAKLNLGFYQKDAKVAEVQYGLGLLTHLQLSEKQNTLLDKELEIINLENTFYANELELKRLVGLGFDESIQTDYSVKIKIKYNENIDLNIEKYIDQTLEVLKKSDAEKAKQMIFDFTAESYKDYDKEYKEALYNLEIAKLEHKDIRKTTEINLKSNYNTLQTLYESYEIANEYAKLYTTKLKDTEQKYKLGLVSELDLMSAQMNLRDKEYASLKAAYDYNKALGDYLLSIKKFEVEE